MVACGLWVVRGGVGGVVDGGGGAGLVNVGSSGRGFK